MVELTPNEIQQKVNAIGYDLLPKKQPNGMYKLECWFGNEVCHGLGKKEYICWKEGLKETYLNFAIKFGIVDKKNEPNF